MRMPPVSLWRARVKDAVIMRISSYALPRRATHFLTAPPSSATLALPHGQSAQRLDSWKLGGVPR